MALYGYDQVSHCLTMVSANVVLIQCRVSLVASLSPRITFAFMTWKAPKRPSFSVQ
jgi:hypothetical protein